MKDEELQELRDIFQGFIDEHRESLQLVAVYGSATRKTDVEGSDIDVIALVDTSGEMKQWKFDSIKNDLEELEDGNTGYELHIQPPKSLKKWWELALQSEPWVITSIEDLQPIYDPEGLCETLKSFPTQRYMDNDLKSREMIYRGLESLEDVRYEVVKEAEQRLEENVVKAAKSIFRFQGKRVPEENLEDRLREIMVEERGLMSDEDVDDLAEVQSYDSDDIDFEKLEDAFESGLQFIDASSDTIRHLEIQRREWIVEESFAEVSEVCKNVLKKEKDGRKLIEDFREEYIEEGDLSNEYEELLEDVLRFKKEKDEGNLEEVQGEDLYSASAKITDFKTAVENVSSYSHEDEQEFARKEDIEEASSQYSALQKFQEKISEEFGDAIKASWILSIEQILETDDFTVKVLVDEEDVDTERLEKYLNQVESSIREETNYRIHSDTVSLPEYWRKLKGGDEGLYSELRYATTLYDPEKIFLPVKQMIEDERLEGTREAIQKEISSSIENTLLLRDRTKVQALNRIYKATVTFGQAMLVSEGFSVPVQKKVPERLREELVEEETLEKEIYDQVRENIRYWKDYEHGEFEEITADELNELHQNAKEVSRKAEELVPDQS